MPPRPGDAVVRTTGAARDEALYFDTMEEKLVAGVARDRLPIYIDLSFLDGRRGAHVNISGISGVATKTTYASFLLYALFHSDVLGNEAANTKALIFNVKGEDLLFLDKPNERLSDEDRADYAALGLPAGPFESVGLWAPVKRGSAVAVPDTGSRADRRDLVLLDRARRRPGSAAAVPVRRGGRRAQPDRRSRRPRRAAARALGARTSPTFPPRSGCPTRSARRPSCTRSTTSAS